MYPTTITRPAFAYLNVSGQSMGNTNSETSAVPQYSLPTYALSNFIKMPCIIRLYNFIQYRISSELLIQQVNDDEENLTNFQLKCGAMKTFSCHLLSFIYHYRKAWSNIQFCSHVIEHNAYISLWIMKLTITVCRFMAINRN